MHRLAVLVSFVAVALISLVAVGRTLNTTAQEGTPMAADQSFVGSWRLTVFPPQGQPHPGLATFAADGTLTVADVPAQPPPPGAPFAAVFFSGGHGVWEATATDGVAFTFDLLGATEQGNPLGTITIRGTATISTDGQRVDATYLLTFSDPTGQVVSSGQGTFQGTRITVEPMGTPAATPVSY